MESLYEMNWPAAIITIVLALALFGVFFMAIRELTTWYWKIDTIITNQERQIELLTELLNQREEQEEDKKPAS